MEGTNTCGGLKSTGHRLKFGFEPLGFYRHGNGTMVRIIKTVATPLELTDQIIRLSLMASMILFWVIIL